MPDPVTRKTNNFDPNSFTVPEFRKHEDGSLNPTNYQAAMELRDFMKRNNELFINADHRREANSKGTVTIGGRVVQLNDRESAMFAKLEGGLFNRLDAGTNGSHDGVIGVEDINQAIRNSWSLHGTEGSPEGHWKDPTASISTTKQQAKERLVALLEDDKGLAHSNNKEFSLEEVNYAINTQQIFDKKKPAVILKDAMTFLDDPASVQAFLLLRKDFDMVDTDKNKFVSTEELQNWKI